MPTEFNTEGRGRQPNKSEIAAFAHRVNIAYNWGATVGGCQMEIPIQLTLDLQTTESKKAEASIDYEDFPEDAANELARLESFNKHLYRPNTYLHKWWARRSGTTFRHILKQLVANPTKRDFYEPGGLEGKVILDPMMGSGTTLHEAIRMGANVIGIDIDPIPVMQARATLTLSPLTHKKTIFDTFFNALRENLSPLYRTTCPSCNNDAEIQFVLYGLRRRCRCNEVLIVDSFLLRENHGHNVYICPRCQQVYTGPDHSCKSTKRHLIEKGTQKCEDCDAEFVDILDEPFPKRYVPLVISGMCPDHGYFFKAFAEHDFALINQARAMAQHIDFGDPRGFRVPTGPKSDDLLHRGITSFQELFTPRQLLYLSTSLDLLSQISKDDRIWLSLLLSTSLEFNSLLCGYKGAGIRRPGAIRHVFSHHAYSFPYTALENNPVFSEKRSGTLRQLFHSRIIKAGQWAVRPVERYIADDKPQKVYLRGEIDGGQPIAEWKELEEGTRKFLVRQGDAASLDIPKEIADYVVTDPPYYDSVQYSDLSNFFRVWLRLFLPQEADWRYDPFASAVSEGDESGNRKYGEVLGAIWQTCHRALIKKHGRLIFTFHHWNPEAWAELTLSLKRANFVLANCHVVFSENPVSVHIRKLKALKHDAILVLRPEIGEESPQQWPRPDQIDASDSYTFCRDCGSALGWFLSTDLDEKKFRGQWQHLMNGEANGNGKAPR
jgi:putative DNA methylase